MSDENKLGDAPLNESEPVAPVNIDSDFDAEDKETLRQWEQDESNPDAERGE